MDQVHVNHLQSATLEQLRDWKNEGQVLIRTAKALGVKPTVIADFEGTFNGAGASTTLRTRARSKTTRRGASTRTKPKPSPQDAVAYLAEHPGISAKQLAQAIGTGYDTIQRWMRQLSDTGQVRREGERNDTKWFAVVRELAGAGV